ncbi:adhesion G protein-coupled receptor F5-like [Hippocampus zosterae]|uniref:adhesion G protein-coupled receptor F5-like n=1 Tax=Hippocampus zosterae TaxID=109293 RepID=UPI00223E15E6|nr:adhesion G protein-coupled receptor F5-like [Hippocampus zosterae]
MAISKNGLIVVLLIVTLCILETGNIFKSSSPEQLRFGEQHIIREKRQEPLGRYQYEVSVELNVTSVETVDYLRGLLRNSSSSLPLGPSANLTHINITQVCYLNGSNFQCRCQEDFFWPSDTCVTYQACDEIVNDACTCIRRIPPDGHHCQPKTGPRFATTVRNTAATLEATTPTNTLLDTTTGVPTTPIATTLTTTVTTRAATLEPTTPTNTAPSSTSTFKTKTSGVATTVTSTTPLSTTTVSSTPTAVSTTSAATPPFVFEYVISIELSTTNESTIDRLRSILRNGTYPIALDVGGHPAVSEINMTTVCSPSSNGVQCRCEDRYRWSCDQCFLHGSCDKVTDDTCGCIEGIPLDGLYCQSIDENVTSVCPTTSVFPTTSFTTLESTTATTPGTDATTFQAPTTVANTTITNMTTQAPTTVANTTITNTTTQAPTTVANTTIANTTTQAQTTVANTTTQAQTTVANTTITNTTTQAPTTVANTTTQAQTTVTNTTTQAQTTVANTTTQAQTTVANTTTQAPTTVTNTTTQAQTTVTNTTTQAQTTVTNTTTQAQTTVANTTITITTPQAPTTVTNTTTQAPTTVVNTTTQALTSATKSTTTQAPTAATNTPSTQAPTIFQLEMSIRLDKEYTPELSDKSSSVYKDFESQIRPVLFDQYGKLTGFVSASVTAFRPGSVITDFTVETSRVDAQELAGANRGFSVAVQPIASVIGSVTALYNSPTQITFPPVTYTGRSMTLGCGPAPESIQLGPAPRARWKLNGKEIKAGGRIRVASSAGASELTVSNVILADAGLYECHLIGDAVTFVQVGHATKIRQAPNVRVPGKVNVKCSDGATQPLQCCVQSDYVVRWFLDAGVLDSEEKTDEKSYCILHRYSLSDCRDSPTREFRFTCRVDDPQGFEETTTMSLFNENVACNDPLYGSGRPNDVSTVACDPGQEGSRTAVCRETGEWILLEDTCIVTAIKDLLVVSEDLVEEEAPQLAANLSEVVQEQKQEIAASSATISAIVSILSVIANVSTRVNETVMENVLATVDVLIGDDARESWQVLRENVTRNDSSKLLSSMETLADELVGEFAIRTAFVQLNRTKFNDSFAAEFNSSVAIDLPNVDGDDVDITVMVFSTLDNVLAPRNASYDGPSANANGTAASFNDSLNAAVALVKVKRDIRNVTLSFKKRNDSLTRNPQCVFWNFSLFDGLGAWDDQGCEFVSDTNDIVTCSCDHLTSFSILMATGIPESIRVALDLITYIGVGVSMASLLVCLLIEALVWKALTRNGTAFMRHVCIVNTALSLLIADICFIIAASYAKNPLENPGEDHAVPLAPCTAATFFMHLFYLALFFWMLASGLLLFYRTVMVFSQMSKAAMMAMGFLFGYVCPLIIAVVTVAATAPGKGYIRENDACWLNWSKTKALLALVIPALVVVFINILIVIAVVFKMLRRGVGEAAPPDEKHTLVVIARCVIILTPLFGLTWALGVGTMVSSTNEGIHIAFAFFNSLQGFFILVFGTLLDSKIRAVLSKKLPVSRSGSGSNQTASTSAGVSSSSGLKWLRKLRGKKYVYHVWEATNSNSASGSEPFSNI